MTRAAAAPNASTGSASTANAAPGAATTTGALLNTDAMILRWSLGSVVTIQTQTLNPASVWGAAPAGLGLASVWSGCCSLAWRADADARRRAEPLMSDLLILGAGLTGLSTAAHTKVPARILEASPFVGGKARTRQRAGARFDVTGHWLHLRDETMKAWVSSLPGLTLKRHDRKARIFSSGVYTLYPFQANTYGLPPQVARACLQGFVDARLHDVELGPDAPQRPAPVTFADWIEQKFGRGIAEHFMFPYNEKIWTVHPRDLSAAWCESSYIPIPEVEDVIAGAVGASREALGYNTHFLYPDDGGGIQGLANAIQATLNIDVETERPVVSVDLHQHRVTTADGEVIPYGKLVSSLPLASLIDACARAHDLPDEVASARALLRSTTVSHLDVLAKGSNHDVEGAWDGQGQPHWVYFPERQFPFYRVQSDY